MQSVLVKQRLAKMGWTTGRLSQATRIPPDQLSKVITGERRTAWIQEAILEAVRRGFPRYGLPVRWDLTGVSLFGALWFACGRVCA